MLFEGKGRRGRGNEEHAQNRQDNGSVSIAEGVETPVMSNTIASHTTFHYNSEDEIEEEEVVTGATSPNVHLNGLPTPKGKHVRFPNDEDETP
ncbi:unnamed protein product [Victoria cruziana]